MLLAVGEQVLPEIPPALLVRMANGFAGGMGRTRDELCGALAGGVILLGLLCGRERTGENDDRCQELVRRWRQGFRERFGTSDCLPIFHEVRLPGGLQNCAGITGDAAALLLGLIVASSVADGHAAVS